MQEVSKTGKDPIFAHDEQVLACYKSISRCLSKPRRSVIAQGDMNQ